MPRRRNSQRRTTRPRRAGNASVPFVRRSNDEVTAVALPRQMGRTVGVPDRLEVDLAYNVNARVNPGAVAYSDTVFNLNSLYDPELTGTGHQPREFDQMAALYQFYRVYATGVEIEVRQRASHGIRAVLVGSGSTTSLTPSDYPAELRRAYVSDVTGSNQPVIRFKRIYDIASILGMTRGQYLASEETDAQTTASPDFSVVLHMYVEQVDGSTAIDFEYTARFVFRAVFHAKRTLSPSLAAPAPTSASAAAAAAVVVRSAPHARAGWF